MWVVTWTCSLFIVRIVFCSRSISPFLIHRLYPCFFLNVFSVLFVFCFCEICPCLSDEKTPLREVTVEFQDASRDPPKEVQQQKQQTAQVDQPSPTLIKYISSFHWPHCRHAFFFFFSCYCCWLWIADGVGSLLFLGKKTVYVSPQPSSLPLSTLFL